MVEPANAGDTTGHRAPENRIPAGMPATLPVLLAHLRCASFTVKSGGVARASLTPGYKLPSLRDENAALGNSPFLLSSTGIVYNDQGNAMGHGITLNIEG